MALSLTIPPEDEPVTLAEVRSQLRVVSTHEDTHVKGLIAAARTWAENYTGRQFLTATWVLTLDAFPAWIDVPRPPLQEVVSIQYVDTAGDTQTLDEDLYRVSAPSGQMAGRARITPALNESWPTTACVIDAVTVTFTAGYGDDAENVPQDIKLAILMRIGSAFENRSGVMLVPPGGSIVSVPGGETDYLAPYKVRAVRVQ